MMKVKQYKKSNKIKKRNIDNLNKKKKFKFSISTIQRKSRRIIDSNSHKKMKKTSKSKTKDKILVNKKMSFGEIINRYPEAGEILMENGMHCFGCSMAMYETLEQGALMHGINPDKLVEKINKKVGKK